MTVRLGDAICVAAITFACSSYSVSSIGIAKPADTVRDSLKNIPVGTPVEEIKRASDARGLLSCAVGRDEAGAQSHDRLGRREATGSMSRCPFWVISRHGSKSDQCLLYPRRRTSPAGRTINSIDLITACAIDLAAWRYSICQSRLPLGLLAGHFL